MTSQASQQAADLLWQTLSGGTRIEALPEALRPQTRAEGYAIQALVNAQCEVPPAGWKIAATSKSGQEHLNVEGPLGGRILAEWLISAGDICPLDSNNLHVAELEFAFRMGDTLPPRDKPYSVNEVIAAAASLHLAIEIPASRYEAAGQAGPAQLIADNACAGRFAIGPAVEADWRNLDLSDHAVTGSVDDGPPQSGNSANVLGDPCIGLTWLVNELSGHGISLEAGQYVSTGTCVPPMAISPGSKVQGDFGVLGTIAITIGD